MAPTPSFKKHLNALLPEVVHEGFVGVPRAPRSWEKDTGVCEYVYTSIYIHTCTYMSMYNINIHTHICA